ncbi:hypothetical protein GE061_007450 [Apolygus lucorum]|uniref:Uncharacterized protein n=1 Tax=Apolygus lucorum TaxID=248454 RepID=A0A8S9WT91_APOLU|nr:hypothetical protein GE061_007450 [Apolygus lucorum]
MVSTRVGGLSPFRFPPESDRSRLDPRFRPRQSPPNFGKVREKAPSSEPKPPTTLSDLQFVTRSQLDSFHLLQKGKRIPK